MSAGRVPGKLAGATGATGAAGAAGPAPAGTGVVMVTAGVASVASPGIDYSKGPWKLFSTVRNLAAAQTLSIPVVSGESNGIVRATGFLLSDGTLRDLTVKINGSATNVTFACLFGQASSVSANRIAAGEVDTYGCFFDLVMLTAHGSNSLKRSGMLRVASATTTLDNYTVLAGFHFKDSATAITSIDIDCGNATGLAANSYALVEEGIVS